MNALERQFAQTVAEHKSTIYTVCYMFSQDADEVNDLFQEVLVNLWKGFDGFEHRSAARMWIYRVARAKKFDANWLFVGIPMIIVFLGWFVYESYQLHQDAFHSGLFWGGCIGGVIGTIGGFSLYFRTQRQYQDIIDQIEDITNG